MKTNKITFGTRGVISAKDEESRTIPFVVSTGTRDRHSTVLNPAGWKLDNFRKNPIVGYMHAPADGFLKPDPDSVIGHDLNSRVEGRELLGVCKFDPAEINLLAERVFRKVIFGSLRACSTFFLEIGKGRYGSGEEGRGKDKETYYFSGQELLEWSIVNVPSNPDAGKRGFGNMRANAEGAIVYALSILGKKLSRNQIENLRVCDVFDLLDGKDLGIRSSDPDKVRKMLSDPKAQADVIAIIEKQQRDLKITIIENKNRDLKDRYYK